MARCVESSPYGSGDRPYGWVSDPHYPRESQRSTVAGQIVLRDPQDPGLKISNVGWSLTAPDYLPRRTGTSPAQRNFTNAPAALGAAGWFPAEVDWQRDAKYYQFWITASANGKFTIPNARRHLPASAIAMALSVNLP